MYPIRNLTANDLQHVADLHAALIPVPYPPSFFINLLIQSNYACLIAHDPDSNTPDTPIAFVSASIHKSNSIIGSPKPHIQLLTLGVHPDYQHKGLARALVQQAINTLHTSPDEPVPPVYTHVCTTNTPAQSFYRRLGMTPFEPTGAGRPLVSRNMYPLSNPNRHREDLSSFFRSRDAYLLVGEVSV
ncbi:acyl-CoA N-acyltransferase [Dendrothele bispora CBS 962.96]|uniref:N-alpha-acetyltransferase 60 n=1 Tax=Dendrothele bispora (strain CBS 962.96) TaxID=1314807 RepID=A0A4S8MU27_DENBC|nr:acyl-CoA N-acyltransferase [Dendrothele bispora CBS 962.96]